MLKTNVFVEALILLLGFFDEQKV